jgi:hypothetical protein
MDIRDINNTYVAKDCVRTNGSDTIDGVAVTGVQIHAAKDDAGAPATTYLGNGELVITDVSGRVLTPATAIKAVSEIVVHQRSFNGENFFTSPAIKGASITGYNLIPFKAASEKVAILHTIDASKANFDYMIKIRKIGTDNMKLKQTTVKTAYFKSAAGGNTAGEIVTGLADYINKNFNVDPLVPISAAVTGASNDELTITALPYYVEVGKFKYEKLNFVVELIEFDGTIEYNDKADLTRNSVTHPQATKGAGNAAQVREMESFGKLFTGANKDILTPAFKRNIVDLETQDANTYDTLVINWTNLQGDFSANVRQEGSLTLFLPVENNNTNQVTDIVTTLDNYIVTEYGTGIPQVGNLT